MLLQRRLVSGALFLALLLAFSQFISAPADEIIPKGKYNINYSQCTAADGSNCAACMASVAQNKGGTSNNCYVTTCVSGPIFSACVQTNTKTDVCCQTGVSTNVCDQCRYWWCSTVGQGQSFCAADPSSCICSPQGGTPTDSGNWTVITCTGECLQ
jgi:hypothetical protein